jgi:hypothetical protein
MCSGVKLGPRPCVARDVVMVGNFEVTDVRLGVKLWYGLDPRPQSRNPAGAYVRRRVDDIAVRRRGSIDHGAGSIPGRDVVLALSAGKSK